MKTLTNAELTQVAGGYGPGYGYGHHANAAVAGYDYGTSGGYVYDQYYRESLSFDYHTYGNQYGAEYGHYAIPHVPHYKGHGY